MGGQFGTANTEEVLNVVKVAVLAVLQEAKRDGWQPKDLGAFLKSSAFEAALAPALKDVGLVPAELTELDFFDGLRLARYGYGVMDDVLDALKGAIKK